MITIDAVIEIPKNTNVKYEYDDSLGMIRCDRLVNTPMVYPWNYGYVPNTKAGDGDPLDILVICNFSLYPNTVIKCKIIGVLLTTDEKGTDEKIIAVPCDNIDRNSVGIDDLDDLSLNLRTQIKYFFEHYKDLEENKWVKVNDFKNSEYAQNIYKKSICK